MNTCVIFCAGGFDRLAEPIGAEDLVIAADGGLLHTQALGLTPQVILGDFDSLGYIPQGAQVFPVQKDDTDSMLAIRLGLERGYRRFLLYGGLDGPRPDHTLANLQALGFLAAHGAWGHLCGLTHRVSAVAGGSLCFAPEAEGTISVFCLGADAQGVTLEGLSYPLENASLTAAYPLGVSNHFTGVPARITVEDGTLIVFYDAGTALPKEAPYLSEDL